MSDFPDILGMELHDAGALLEAEGLTFVIAETKAVKGEVTDGVFRVVRVQLQTAQTSPAPDAGPAGPETGPDGQDPGKRVLLTVCRI